MQNATTVAPRTKYHSDAIYVMYAMYVLIACVFMIIAMVFAYHRCKWMCDDCGVCQQSCVCCKSNEKNIPHYVVTTEVVPTEVLTTEVVPGHADYDFEFDDYMVQEV